VKDAIEILTRFSENEIYGDVLVKFEAGKVVHIKVSESIKTKLSKQWRKRWGVSKGKKY
jgi:hypothetical protein